MAVPLASTRGKRPFPLELMALLQHIEFVASARVKMLAAVTDPHDATASGSALGGQ